MATLGLRRYHSQSDGVSQLDRQKVTRATVKSSESVLYLPFL